MAKVLAYDIDGILTIESDTKHEDLPGTYTYRSPNPRTKAQIFRAFKQGWTVVFFTGRRENQRRITEDWLSMHGFHWHFLIMGKPYFTYFVDDRNRTVDEIDEILDNELLENEPREESGNEPMDLRRAKGIELDTAVVTGNIGKPGNDLSGYYNECEMVRRKRGLDPAEIAEVECNDPECSLCNLSEALKEEENAEDQKDEGAER
ncbi:MAG: hypothetical protein JSW58_08185 [Candidatus Latescibacterota bacterium]|nr:MAG: hypothetical protein JSW58_08185 [Candidatus Latescibacterota bacterium]